MNYFSNILLMLERSEIRVTVTQRRIIIFKNRSYICSFENFRKHRRMKRDTLAKNEMGLLSSFLNSFEKLVGMLAGPNAFLAFSELIIDVTSSSFIVLNVKVSLTGSER